MQSLSLISFLTLFMFLPSCTSNADSRKKTINGNGSSRLLAESFGEFNEPWAMTFLPDGDLLVTEKSGSLLLVLPDDRTRVVVKGVPKVAYGGQGGFGDVILHPQYNDNHWIYLSYAEEDASGNRGAVVIRATFNPGSGEPKL